MLVGYMRVSSNTDRQTTDLQRDVADKASGARDNRPGLQ
jgi:DNA invertase Pin-like site-specific DNA recombinase